MTIKLAQQNGTRSPASSGPPLSPTFRKTLVVLAGLMLAGFGLAIVLTPSSSGRGTHQQLGLPPCSILSLTGIPCPTCGMTTSFSHFVRGSWRQSIEANTSGFLLACGCIAFLPWSVMTAIRGDYWLLPRIDKIITWVLPGWLLFVFLEWGWRNLLPF